MRILILGINYSPEETGIAPYTAGLAEHLAGRGYSVCAVTGLPSYPQWRGYDGGWHVLWKREAINGVDVRRGWHYLPRRPPAVRRALRPHLSGPGGKGRRAERCERRRARRRRSAGG